MHVQSSCFAHKDNCFLTLLLSSSSWSLLKVANFDRQLAEILNIISILEKDEMRNLSVNKKLTNSWARTFCH